MLLAAPGFPGVCLHTASVVSGPSGAAMGSRSAFGAGRPESDVKRGEDRTDQLRGEPAVELASMRRAMESVAVFGSLLLF
jgi:hypothetical protein